MNHPYHPRKHDPHLENAEIVVKKRDLARWAWLVAFFAFFCMAFFLALGAEAPKAPVPPKALGAPTSPAPDPCGLAVVECPQEPASEATASQAKPQKVITATVYTYQAVESQTDGDPCRTASGWNLCAARGDWPGIVANNCLAFGTQVAIRDAIYQVQDRMNARYGCDVFDVLTQGENYRLTNEPVEVL